MRQLRAGSSASAEVRARNVEAGLEAGVAASRGGAEA